MTEVKDYHCDTKASTWHKVCATDGWEVYNAIGVRPREEQLEYLLGEYFDVAGMDHCYFRPTRPGTHCDRYDGEHLGCRFVAWYDYAVDYWVVYVNLP